jgi:hypothetical protein
MTSAVRLPEGSILTVAALALCEVRQSQDSTIRAMIAAGSSQSFGPYPLDRDFVVSGNATITTAEASLGAQVLDLVEVTASATISKLHANKMLQVNSGSNVTLTLPADLPAGFSFLVDQVGAGLAIFAVASGASKVNRSSFDRSAGAGAIMNAYVRSNADGASAVWVLGGDGATA